MFATISGAQNSRVSKVDNFWLEVGILTVNYFKMNADDGIVFTLLMVVLPG